MNHIMNFSNPTTAYEWANLISKTRFIPKEYWERPNEIIAAIQYGSELNIPPMQALQGIGIINGKPSVYGDLLLGLCQLSPDFIDCIESIENDTAICIARRKGREDVRRTFSKQDAILAGLWNIKDNWKKYPNRMLQMRARSFALRDTFADILKGVIAYEEAQDYHVEKPARVIEEFINTAWPEDEVVTLDEALEAKEAEELDKNILYSQMMKHICKYNVPENFIQACKAKAKVFHLRNLSAEQMQAVIEYIDKKYVQTNTQEEVFENGV